MDTIDSKIIRYLMLEGRITNSRLARAVGLSESATLERVRRLEASGIIEGYGARIDPGHVDRSVEVFMTFSLRQETVKESARLEKAIASMDEVLSCAQVLGRFDFIAHVAVRDVETLERFIHEKLLPLGLLERLESFTVLKTLKRGHPPLPNSV